MILQGRPLLLMWLLHQHAFHRQQAGSGGRGLWLARRAAQLSSKGSCAGA
jgi:hypothetical protein